MIRIVLRGFQGGGLVVNGKPFSTASSMTSFGLPPPVGLTDEEIADVMNCPIGTVRSRIFRAREAIAQRLRPLLDTRDGERW